MPLGQSLVSPRKNVILPLSWVKKENLSKDELLQYQDDLKSDKKQYGGTSCDHWKVGIVLRVEFCTAFWMYIYRLDFNMMGNIH